MSPLTSTRSEQVSSPKASLIKKKKQQQQQQQQGSNSAPDTLKQYLHKTFHSQSQQREQACSFDPTSRAFDLVFKLDESDLQKKQEQAPSLFAMDTPNHLCKEIYVHKFFVMARSNYLRRLLKGYQHLHEENANICEVFVHSEMLECLSYYMSALYGDRSSRRKFLCHSHMLAWHDQAMQIIEQDNLRTECDSNIDQDFLPCLHRIYNAVTTFNEIRMDDHHDGSEKYVKNNNSFDLTIQLYNPYCEEELMKEYRVHKLFLFRSPFMRTIMQSGMQETQSSVVKFHTISVEGFHHVLQYLYTNHSKIPREHVVEIFVFAQLMELSDLSSICIRILDQMIDKDNVYDVLSLEELTAIPSILDKCAHVLTEHIDQINAIQLASTLPKFELLLMPKVIQKIAFCLANEYESIPKDVYSKLSVDIRIKVQDIRKKQLLKKR
ncbi:hypothetical protein C9374_005578 [Naegleria lovaniensis]|uniref:BTB domain-containing protein n=1 Tax=Naegleria lovaniensis TaxID=51637 RepID=A0AA88GNE9_NAELO|nr:uncharacterized protein C9374_005578 [Naegleria lovaniensis]KAG2382376.1 hypothetical protein C9374_005578 [Naegleria lovaniensis]